MYYFIILRVKYDFHYKIVYMLFNLFFLFFFYQKL